MRSPERLAESVVLLVKSALAPIVEQARATEARLAAMSDALGNLRERVAVAEAREPIAGPAGAPGADGVPGAKGADGFTCDELLVEQDAEDDRLVRLAFRRGEETKTIGTLRFSMPRYCGVFAVGRRYMKGDQVTMSGALWHCNAETTARPGTGAPEWTMQVKRGDAR